MGVLMQYFLFWLVMVLIIFGGVGIMNKLEIQKILKGKSLYPFSYDFFDIIIHIESSYNPFAYNVVSGAKGLMQLTRIACLDVGRDYEQLYHGEYNIDTGYVYFKKLYYDYSRITGQDLKKIICAYNMGIGNLNNLLNVYGDDFFKHLDSYPETKNYLLKFESFMSEKGKNWGNII
jgi:soluble lytic murein transglycosylase-like protein